ncbi:UdgX family uracil-DNA binding protein [Xylophilus sp. GOD-11R]|uniref:UdgX family uracil-DNA binding protein n=1 Tax=Xylophilus sp. GOD-11R TaxID=3089814 RepID=UPI00298CA4A5|nr:UdgX family uracil-DNA binding protein [Xylophilus sp. GOD-11R]WPB57019.1 UdgX family uracil-DNA binding protein [Xylophilus sp. GOD-11R]
MEHRRRIQLPDDTDLDAFRRHARALVMAGVAPPDVEWQVADDSAVDLFGAEDIPLPPATDGPAPSPNVPPDFIALCRSVILHRDPGRFGLLYRLLWRLQHEPGLRHDPLDADMLQAERLAKAVRRDQHKMTAFVRFRTVAAPEPGGPDLHVAWFEPEHHIVAATAPFFARRFANMHWAILTPRASIRWFPPHDGEPGRMEHAPGARREDAPPADAGESLWLTYYANIFNPARLKLAMMQKEMPRKYWHNLPEARLIGKLSAQAMERSGTMIEQPTTTPARRIRHLPIRADDTPAPTTVLRLDELKAATDRCRECPIGQFATQSVVGEGPRQARLMVVGEQPGDHEDLRGRPFVGPAGQLFDRAVAELGWQRDRLYVTNAVKHFKYELRGKRRMHKSPGQLEVAACRHWLEDELRLVEPRAILALGATAARAILGRPVAVTRERGQWLEDDAGRPVLVTLHPSALLRADPQYGAENFAAWIEDLKQASAIAMAD